MSHLDVLQSKMASFKLFVEKTAGRLIPYAQEGGYDCRRHSGKFVDGVDPRDEPCRAGLIVRKIEAHEALGRFVDDAANRCTSPFVRDSSPPCFQAANESH